MPSLPHLVRDSQLDSSFLPDITVHRYQEPDFAGRKRLVARSEYWKRTKRIGDGGYSSVWLEECVQGASQAVAQVRAVKQIYLDPRYKHANLNRELEAIAKFSHSKYERCFVKSFGWYKSSEYIFITMEYLEKGDLSHYLCSRQALMESEAREVAYQILDGLNLMHENGFVHRDIKPNNILIRSCPPDPWWVKISDFGISKSMENTRNTPSTIRGTLGYMAPEAHGFIPHDSPYAVDIWATGETIVQMLTRKPTFDNAAVLRDYISLATPFPHDELGAVGVSMQGRRFIALLMAPVPAARLSAQDALTHDWMATEEHHSSMSSVGFQEARFSGLPGPNISTIQDSARWTTNVFEHSGQSNNATVSSTTRVNEENDSPTRTVNFSATPKATDSTAPTRKLVSSPTPNVRGRAVQPTFPSLVQEIHSQNRIEVTAISPNEMVLLSASDNGLILAWDLVTAERTHSVLTSLSKVRALCAIDSRRFVVSGPTKRKWILGSVICETVQVWDFSCSTPHHELTLKSQAADLASSHDGKTIAIALHQAGVILWDVSTGERKTQVGSCESVCLSRDGKTLARIDDSCVAVRTIGVGPVGSYRIASRFGVLGRKISGPIKMSSSPDCEILACAFWKRLGEQGSLYSRRTFLCAPGTDIGRSIGNEQTTDAQGKQEKSYVLVAFVHNEGLFAVGQPDEKTLQVWKLLSPGQVGGLFSEMTSSNIIKGPGIRQIRTALLFPSCELLAIVTSQGDIILWDLRTKSIQKALHANSPTRGTLALSPDGALVATRMVNNTITVWDVSTGKSLTRSTVNRDPISMTFSADSKRLLLLHSGPGLTLWHLDSNKTLSTGILVNFEQDPPRTSYAVSPDAQKLASVSYDTESVWIRSLPEPLDKVKYKLPDKFVGPKLVAFSPDGRSLAVQSSDYIGLMNLSDGTTKTQKIPESGTRLSGDPVFSPDGRLIACMGCEDRGPTNVTLWCPSTGQAKMVYHDCLPNMRDLGKYLAFKPDGTLMACGHTELSAEVCVVLDKNAIQQFSSSLELI